MSVVVAIHQPNFFPWLGYFDKIVRSDIFIVMDNVQCPKKGGTWLNRSRLIVGGQPTWMTLPIVRSYHGKRRIDEIAIDESTLWREKYLKSLRLNYGKAPHFYAVYPFVEELVRYPTTNLKEFNLSCIRAIIRKLGIPVDTFVDGTSLNVSGAATELLIEMVRSVNGSVYMCGGGADGYQDDALFAEQGIELRYQQFRHPAYMQCNTESFVEGLSIIDALVNCGFDGTRMLLMKDI